MIPSKVLGSKIHTMVVQLHYFFFFFSSIFPFCLAKHLQISFVPNTLYNVIYLLLDESNLYVRKITLHENHSGFLYIFFLFLFSLVFFSLDTWTILLPCQSIIFSSKLSSLEEFAGSPTISSSWSDPLGDSLLTDSTSSRRSFGRMLCSGQIHGL